MSYEVVSLQDHKKADEMGQFDVIKILKKKGGLSADEICKMMRVGKNSVGVNLTKLHKKGVLCRKKELVPYGKGHSVYKYWIAKE